VYGLEPVSDKSHVITDFIHQALKTNCIKMLTDGHEQRQFLYARDCAECLYILSQRYNDLPRDIEYHVTSFEWASISKIANSISDIIPGITITPGHCKDKIQSGNKIEPNNKILEYWKPSTDLRSGIKQLIESYK